MIRNFGTRLTDEQITILEAAGFNRWTNYGKDRLYASPASIGLTIDRYKSGNISFAELNGEKISNSYAVKILSNIDKAYIDVETSKICANKAGIALLKEAIEKL